MKKNLLTVLVLSSGLLLSACDNGGDGGGGSSSTSNADVNNIANPVVGTPTAYSLTDFSAAAAESVVMTYKMKGIKGTETQATALVFTPKTAPPAGGWPAAATPPRAAAARPAADSARPIFSDSRSRSPGGPCRPAHRHS